MDEPDGVSSTKVSRQVPQRERGFLLGEYRYVELSYPALDRREQIIETPPPHSMSDQKRGSGVLEALDTQVKT